LRLFLYNPRVVVVSYEEKSSFRPVVDNGFMYYFLLNKTAYFWVEIEFLRINLRIYRMILTGNHAISEELVRVDFGEMQFVYESSSGYSRLDRAYTTIRNGERYISPQYFYKS